MLLERIEHLPSTVEVDGNRSFESDAIRVVSFTLELSRASHVAGKLARRNGRG
jgi:hypothetical protein